MDCYAPKRFTNSCRKIKNRFLIGPAGFGSFFGLIGGSDDMKIAEKNTNMTNSGLIKRKI